MAATQEADIAIIGAGIIGLSCAYELARQGAGRVVVFDKGGPVFGTTGGSAGVICPVELGDPYIVMGLLGYARVLELASEHGLGYQQRGGSGSSTNPTTRPSTRTASTIASEGPTQALCTTLRCSTPTRYSRSCRGQSGAVIPPPFGRYAAGAITPTRVL